jgi:uncharacterized protein (TIGR00251 family)
MIDKLVSGRGKMEQTVLEIRVIPRSSGQRIVVDDNDTVRVYLNAPPVEGRANSECIALLSKRLGIAKSRISIERGERGRRKRILIGGLSLEEVLSILRKDK